MKLELLAQGLRAEKPAARLNIVRVIGMVEETQLLPEIRQRFAEETDPQVRSALEWAGKRVYQAYQKGYNTLDAIFHHFNIDREIANHQSEAEAEIIRRMQNSFQNNMVRDQLDAGYKKAGLTAGAALGGMMLGGGSMAQSVMSGGLMAGADIASSNLGGTREVISNKRTPAPRPSTADVSVWIKRLREDADPNKRKAAAIELGNLNNIAALPHFAIAFTADSVADVRETAEKFGKILYWSAVYWQMTEEGSLEKEVSRRIKALEGSPQAASQTPLEAAPVKPKEEDIGELLRRAQEKRAKKKK